MSPRRATFWWSVWIPESFHSRKKGHGCDPHSGRWKRGPPNADCTQGLAQAQRQLPEQSHGLVLELEGAAGFSLAAVQLRATQSACLNPRCLISTIYVRRSVGPSYFIPLCASTNRQCLSLGTGYGRVPARSVTSMHDSRSKIAEHVQEGVGRVFPARERLYFSGYLWADLNGKET